MRCKGCVYIKWVDDSYDAIPSEVQRCEQLDRKLTPHESLSPLSCPFRDNENLGRGTDERLLCD